MDISFARYQYHIAGAKRVVFVMGVEANATLPKVATAHLKGDCRNCLSFEKEF